MTLAIIKTGGKQYLISPGKKLKIEKLEGKPANSAGKNGEKIIFDQVLLFADEQETKIGAPFIAGAKVEAEVLKQGRADKVIIFKYRPKKRYKVKRGHRQPYTEVEIKNIELGE